MLNLKIAYVSDHANLKRVAADIAKSSVVGIDTETTHLDPLLGKIRLLQIATADVTWVLDCQRLPKQAVLDKVLKPLLPNKSVVKVMQNAKFDIKFLQTYFGYGLEETEMLFDTYLAAKLLVGGQLGTGQGCGLDDLCSRLLNVHLDKSFQKFDWAGTLYKEPIAYAGLDAAVLLPLYRLLAKSLADNKLLKVAKLEFECTPAIAQLELNGIQVDKNKWLDIAEKGKEEMYQAELVLRQYFGDINLDSNPQLCKALSEMTGMDIKSVAKGALEDLVKGYYEKPDLFGRVTDYRLPVMRLQEYNAVKKMQNSFGPAFLNHIHKVTGRIHPEYTQIETNTARQSCLAGWSMVRTPFGPVQLQHLTPGDIVWTHKERARAVTAFIPQGIKETYDVTLCNGDILTCTLDHKLLCSDGQWRELQEIANALFKSVGWESGQPNGASEKIQGQVNADDPAGGKRYGYPLPERPEGSAAGFTRSREEGAEVDSPIDREAREQESYVRQEPGATPQLEGGLRRWIRIPNEGLGRREKTLRSPYCDDGASRYNGAAEGNGCAPHRFEPTQQSAGQFSFSDQERTSRYSLFTGEGQPFCSIKEVNYRGSIPVYDISVEEDESFSVAGIFVHNCRNPNLQQIPRDSYMRAAFVAGEGNVMWNSDYSQIELRGMAQFTKDAGYVNAFINNLDLHAATAASMFHVPIENVTGDQRHAGKTINFGVPYGMGAPRYSAALDIPIEQAKKELKAFYDAHPGLVRWHQSQFRYFQAYSCVRSASGRIRALPHWRYDEYASQQAAKNFPIQSSEADITKLAMTRCFRELPSDVKLVNVVHDELVHELPERDVKEIGPEIDRIMRESAEEFITDIPIKVDGHSAPCWSKD